MAKWIDAKLTVNTRGLDTKLARVRREIDGLPEETYRYWQSQTPVRSGRARANTTLKGTTIHADYPYAGRLDEGWSNQSPRGMTTPTLEWLRRRWLKIFKGR